MRMHTSAVAHICMGMYEYVLTDFWEYVLICVKIKHCETKLEQAVKEREVINNHKNHDNDNK